MTTAPTTSIFEAVVSRMDLPPVGQVWVTDFLGLLFKVKKEGFPSYHTSHTFRTELGSKESLRSSCCPWIFPPQIFILSLCLNFWLEIFFLFNQYSEYEASSLSHFDVVSRLSTVAWTDLWAPKGCRIKRWKKAGLAALKEEGKREIWDPDQVKLALFRYFDHGSPCRVCSPRKITSNHDIWNT